MIISTKAKKLVSDLIDEKTKLGIKLGKSLGLYKNEHVAKNCTPSYLPEFIRIEVAKRSVKL